jgi:hypothetical protein
MQGSINSTDADYNRSLETGWNSAQVKFYASERCSDARRMLQELVDSTEYETTSLRFDSGVDFSKRHLDYISKQPHLDLIGYMSNLRLMTRKRN